MSPSPPPQLSPEEQEQILQTIEMFEVIVQANPQDSQSMEILKDAYSRLGMKTEMLTICRKLADTYSELAQYSQAMLEFENILKHDADNPEIVAAMGEVEEKMNRASKSRPAPTGRIGADFSVLADTGTLMTTSATMRSDGSKLPGGGSRADEVPSQIGEDGNEALAKFLTVHRLANEEIIQASLERVTRRNEALAPDQLGASLIDEIVRRGGGELEAILCGILDRTKFAYIPLELYEIDRQIVKMLPETITLNRLIVPFDVMSRTLMIATANPFDSLGKQAVQQLLDYSIQWHLASPEAIFKALSDTYRTGTGRGGANILPGVSSGGAVSPGASASQTESAAAAANETAAETAAFRLAK